jgi:hypothetical protein
MRKGTYLGDRDLNRCLGTCTTATDSGLGRLNVVGISGVVEELSDVVF